MKDGTGNRAMWTRQRRRVFTRAESRAFTLIELMIVVAIVGTLAALATYGVRKYISYAKTTEARDALGRMAKDATTAYERESMKPDILPVGQSTAVVNNLCTDAAHPVPDDISKVGGRKYQSAAADWTTGNSSTAGFVCLQFSMTEPQYYMYDYKGTAGPTGTFAATARGDLNGDGVASTFTISGRITEGRVHVSPSIQEDSPEE
jgi:type IV pilus assembly protein PilA